ncbi:RNA polymerase sigma factor [Kutzneria kofuensis]|uniref:RNA polymerase sigma factor (Sigma-70 family) n=1 Tax=Kutzneria kofuensis TaxID=103725 RepID=A0A7W9NLW7_9PSEU|nr:RNA polymerase sigma factor [Kutzneria kofuensis]MBB5897500.1 RNA polymerase sigma factor (sigma-70 family) [Kutzneria kofuensis]
MSDVVARAVDGDQDALREIVHELRDPLYRLALRMVWRPADAEDATQEILIQVITRLASFRGEAKLLTWAYRIGVNYLLNLRRKTPQEARELSLDEFRADLAEGLAAEDYGGPDAELLAHEVRLSCTQAVLQCLERSERIAFVLGDIFELTSTEAAWVLDISSAAYRKRLERARERLRAFMGSTCGIVTPSGFCRCARRVSTAVSIGRIDAAAPALVGHAVNGRGVQEAAAQLHRLHDAAAVLRAHPDYAASRSRTDAILGLLRSGSFPLLE